MPTYNFKLRSNGDCLTDDVGVALPDAAAAHRYACGVARDLMRCRETATRHWLLEVYQNRGRHVCDVLFASVDPTLDHLRRETRTLVESVNAKRRVLEDEIYSAKLTMDDSRALIARSRGKPYLIARNGELAVRSLDRV